MSKKRLAIDFVIILIILLGVITFSVIRSYAASLDASKIKDKLEGMGIDISEASLKGQELKVRFSSKGVEKITPDDIFSIQSVKNEARNAENQGLIQTLSLVIESVDGREIYDSTKKDIMDIPEVPETSPIPKNTLDTKQTEEKLYHALSEKNLAVIKLDIISMIDGKTVSLIIQSSDTDVSKVNDLIPKVQEIIEWLNKTDETGIYQYNLTIQDKNGQPLIVLAADLIYREFTWWLTPAFGNNSWAGSDPETDGE